MFHHDAVDKQVEDLRERMRLLQQDRRANIDLLETTKVTNTTEIRSLKQDNKKLRSRLANLQKILASDNDKNQNEVDDMKKLVLQKRNDYDSHKSSATQLSKRLNKLRDEAKMCGMEGTRPSHEGEPLSRQIGSLENR
jgi:chromosome segregation ATPase